MRLGFYVWIVFRLQFWIFFYHIFHVLACVADDFAGILCFLV